MIIYKCDICEKEIKDLNESGLMQIKKKKFIFVKHRKSEDQNVLYEYLLCKECTDEIDKKMAELKKRNQQE